MRAALLALWATTVGAEARHGSDDGDRDRDRFIGRITARPAGIAGDWTIGGRTVTADGAVELDELDGPLELGACASVDLRDGRVHEIDSEPASDCR
ncbi:MAG: hypothetical protein ABMB14_29435 [Myxococcota bacterium]